jgi:hypothetical protein
MLCLLRSTLMMALVPIATAGLAAGQPAGRPEGPALSGGVNSTIRVADVIRLVEVAPGRRAIPIPPGVDRPIVDRRSTIEVVFDSAALERALPAARRTALEQEWKEFIAAPANASNVAKARAGNADAEDLLNSLWVQRFLESPGLMVTAEAVIIPADGEPFGVPVGGYTSVKEEPPSTPAAGDTPAKRRPVVSTTSRVVRVHRFAPAVRLDQPSELGAVKLESDLESATIDLTRLRVLEGDILRIIVTNHHGPAPRSDTFEFRILDTGWETKQDATLLLVKRVENLTTAPDVENNFKPAAGTSFLVKFTSRNRLWNFIDPSFGVNGSFLDFRADKDFEIGVGPVVSVFNGIIQVSAGWNLHVTKDRFYWSLGLGFLDIAGKLKELKK